MSTHEDRRAERVDEARELLYGTHSGYVDAHRRPYVGEGADGARRSAEIDRSEADTLDRNDPRRDEILASAERWDAQADELEEEPITSLTDPDYDGPWDPRLAGCATVGERADLEAHVHPAVRGALAVSYLDRNGRRKMPLFIGPERAERAWEEFERRDAKARESGGERPRIMRWNGATWQLHDEAK